MIVLETSTFTFIGLLPDHLILRDGRGKAAFFWLAFNVSVTIWCYFFLPETRNLSYAELDM